MFDSIILENKKELYAAVGEFYKARRGWFLIQGEIICCAGDNCNTGAPSLPPAGNKNIAISYEAKDLRLRGWGGYCQKNFVGVCGLLPKSLTLFMTKICDIPYPSYDLTKNSKPYL